MPEHSTHLEQRTQLLCAEAAFLRPTRVPVIHDALGQVLLHELPLVHLTANKIEAHNGLVYPLSHTQAYLHLHTHTHTHAHTHTHSHNSHTHTHIFLMPTHSHFYRPRLYFFLVKLEGSISRRWMKTSFSLPLWPHIPDISYLLTCSQARTAHFLICNTCGTKMPTFSSKDPVVSRRYMKTFFCCPSRQTRAIACRSLAGFQSVDKQWRSFTELGTKVAPFP